MKKAAPQGRLLTTGEQGRSALDAIFEEFAGGESGHTLGRNFDLFPGLGIETLALGTLARLKGTKTQDGNFFALHHRIDDGVDGRIHDQRDVGLGELGAGSNEINEISFVHGLKVGLR